jgi:hypothetical protein
MALLDAWRAAWLRQDLAAADTAFRQLEALAERPKLPELSPWRHGRNPGAPGV